jgi:hypothetical protein
MWLSGRRLRALSVRRVRIGPPRGLFVQGPRLLPAVRRSPGVFPVDPSKPDARQAAQQAMFLCVANPALTFVENLAANISRFHFTA